MDRCTICGGRLYNYGDTCINCLNRLTRPRRSNMIEQNNTASSNDIPTMLKKVHLKIVRIEWVDSVQPLESWTYINELPDMKIVKCQSMGWVVQQSEDAVRIAQSIDSEQKQVMGVVTIPISAITNIKIIT
jgi:sulfur transfer protein SufE